MEEPTESAADADRTSEQRPLRHSSRWARVSSQWLDSVWTVGIVLLVVTKLGDIVTTAAGLLLVDGLTERNPAAAAVIEAAGLVGLVGVSIAAIALVVVVVESVVATVESMDDVDLDTTVLYACSYIPLATVSTFATIHNLLLILSVS